jgi:hypothetical protein
VHNRSQHEETVLLQSMIEIVKAAETDEILCVKNAYKDESLKVCATSSSAAS